MAATIHQATTDAMVLRCFPVVHELRPHIEAPEDLLARVRRQQEQGYRMAFLEQDGRVMSVAGFRIVEMLAWGKSMYVDDLITTSAARGSGCGSRLFDWLIAAARQAGCDQVHLDSGVHRFGAHRFYLHKGMDITSHHFALKLRE